MASSARMILFPRSATTAAASAVVVWSLARASVASVSLVSAVSLAALAPFVHVVAGSSLSTSALSVVIVLASVLALATLSWLARAAQYCYLYHAVSQAFSRSTCLTISAFIATWRASLVAVTVA